MYQRARSVVTVVAVLLLVSMAVYVSAGSESVLRGVDAGEINAEYVDIQKDPTVPDEDKIITAVNTYFKLQYESMIRGVALDLSTVIATDTRDGLELNNYQLGRMQYSLVCWQETNTVFASYDYLPEYEEIVIEGDQAVVEMWPRVELSYVDTYHTEICGVLHTLRLKQSDGVWKIVCDQYSDEFTLLFPRGTDFAELEATLPDRLEQMDVEMATLQQQLATDQGVAYRFDPERSEVLPMNYRTYNRGNAAWYGTTYTDNTGTCSTTYYNPLFVEYASGGRCVNCQNFVSQCIWYGFGGVNTSTAINNRWLPMVYNIAGADDWWATSSTTGTNWTWTYVPGFRDLVTNNFNNDLVGVHGSEGSLSVTWQGDYVALSNWSHVWIVVDIIDHNGDGSTDYNEIYVSAHTNNRNNRRLSTLVADPTNIRYMWIHRFKEQ